MGCDISDLAAHTLLHDDSWRQDLGLWLARAGLRNVPPGQRCGRGEIGFYNDVVLPGLLDHAIRHGELVGYRRRVVGAAQGRVLEVGIGSGLNLPFYGPNVTEIIGLEPSRTLIDMASRRARANDTAVLFLAESAEGSCSTPAASTLS